jgi:hypothetical protein
LCEEVECVRDFWGWLSRIGVTPYNAFRTRQHVETPHSFSFKLFQDLTPEEARVVPGRAVPYRPHDVLCCVKAFMRDTQLMQPPVLLIPQERAAWPSAVPQDVVARHPYSDDRRRQLMQLVQQLEGPGLGMQRAASYIRGMLNPPPFPPFPPSQLEWLQRAAPAPAALPAALGDLFPQLPVQLWRLKAAFHRTV